MLQARGDERLLAGVEMPSTCLHRYRNYAPPSPFTEIRSQNVAMGHMYYWAIVHKEVRIAYLITGEELEAWRGKAKTIIPAYSRREEPVWEKKYAMTLGETTSDPNNSKMRLY